jgi:hypothetical protein
MKKKEKERQVAKKRKIKKETMKIHLMFNGFWTVCAVPLYTNLVRCHFTEGKNESLLLTLNHTARLH